MGSCGVTCSGGRLLGSMLVLTVRQIERPARLMGKTRRLDNGPQVRDRGPLSPLKGDQGRAGGRPPRQPGGPVLYVPALTGAKRSGGRSVDERRGPAPMS